MPGLSTAKKKDVLGMSHSRFYSLLVLGIVLVLWFLPTPIGLKPQAWHLFAIFLGTIVAFVAQPMSTGAIALISFVAVVLTKIVSVSEALGYFSNSNTWLIVSAFIYARGFIKTGLGRRIAFLLTKAFGDKTIKLAYALSLSDLIMAPAVPSNTARAGSVLFPIVRSLCSTFKSEPGETSRRIGAFLIQSVFQCNAVTSAIFMTAMAANPMVAELAGKTLNVQISWGTWLMGAIVPGLLSLLVPFYSLYCISSGTESNTGGTRDGVGRTQQNGATLFCRKNHVNGFHIIACILVNFPIHRAGYRNYRLNSHLCTADYRSIGME